MSSSAGPSDTKDGDRRRSLGKYVKRMSSVFKREKSTKNVAVASGSASAPASEPKEETVLPVGKEQEQQQKQEPEQKEEATTAETAPTSPTEAAPETPAVPTVAPTPALAPAPTAALVSATPAPAAPVTVTKVINRAALQQERARALFSKYGLTLETHDWISVSTHPVSVQRVERPIRMRVHRSCHHCGTSYGPEKVCNKCEHKRCKRCPRYPPRKTSTEKSKEQEAVEAPKKKKGLTMTNKHGEERVYRQIKQRVRRSCHHCQAYFVPAMATVCEQCRHVRCTKCPRDPAKLNKWPNGYPGDAEPDSETDVERAVPTEARRMWRKPRMRVRWECEECHSHFIEGSPRCPGCGHERCEKCTRKPLKKVKKEQQFDPDVIRAVEEKLRALVVADDHPTSGTETI